MTKKQILRCIAFSGEMPWSSIDLLQGERRIILRYLKKLKDQNFVSVHGNGVEKTIRLTKKGAEKFCTLKSSQKHILPF